jgi:uncharacterized DUF497 family protein
MAVFLYEFEWDPDKARINFSKHGVSFELAAEVFCDPHRPYSSDFFSTADENRSSRL